MSYQKDRDEFIARCSAAGMPLDLARALLRNATTIQRLAVALCNGDWPADNGDRKTKLCETCGMGWAPSSFLAGVCPDCAAEDRVRKALKDTPWEPIFSGDPRGACLKIKGPGIEGNSFGCPGALCVPTRN